MTVAHKILCFEKGRKGIRKVKDKDSENLVLTLQGFAVMPMKWSHSFIWSLASELVTFTLGTFSKFLRPYKYSKESSLDF